jgi:ABC-type Zn uptake system ZnuABC Zn-binding protein ZnuA
MAPQTLKKAKQPATESGTKKTVRIDVEAITGMTTEERRKEIFGPTGRPKATTFTPELLKEMREANFDFGEGDEFERWLDEIRGRNKPEGESERQ